ncbi:signal peptidase complex-like protein DTM1 [Macadamia integrifolia]|uniref:signal peptidase complex-like protein DTM1 n=1 Tax=Macadamia integrifolia TaxID=60698 RepID=UPI001C4F8E6D|nr:signal peptidase complex-like protein DTM1 [Macadamia integrifolia]
MASSDAVLRFSLVCVGAIVLLIGIYTHSFKKMIVTYLFGLFAIAGVLLPDWDFFDRDLSQWSTPVPGHINTPTTISPQTFWFSRFRIYPLRLIVYTSLYGYGLYKWWMFVSS